MPLSDANLRYLFAVSDLAAGGRPVRSKEVADVLGVTRPSVVRVLRTLAEHGLVEKAPYGKITLTERCFFAARYYRNLVERINGDFPSTGLELTPAQRWQASLVLAAALPDTEYLRRCPPALKTPEGSGCEA